MDRPAGLTFWIPGKPSPQGSKTRTPWGFRESSPNVKAWREAVAEYAMVNRRGMRWAGPTEVLLQFHLAREYDVDKLARAVLDGLVDGGLLEDDHHVCHLDVWRVKVLGSPERHGVLVTIRDADAQRPEQAVS